MSAHRPARGRLLLGAVVSAAVVGWAIVPAADVLHAQTHGPPLEVELGGGMSVGKLASAHSGTQFEPGPALSVSLLASLTERLRVYAGFRRTSFGCSQGLCSGADVRLGSRGVGLGLETRWRQLRARGGIAHHQARTEWTWSDGGAEADGDGAGSTRTGGNWGLEGGAGIVIPLGRGFALTPTARYLRIRASFPDSPAVEGASGDVMSHYTLELGLRAPIPGADP